MELNKLQMEYAWKYIYIAESLLEYDGTELVCQQTTPLCIKD